MFEHRRQKLLSRKLFLKRVLAFIGLAGILVSGALAVGIPGYHFICHLSWLDALLNASMILTGMGPVDPMDTPEAKWFASFYALFSGVVFLSSIGVVLAPVFHRMMHKFHLDAVEPKDTKPTKPAS